MSPLATPIKVDHAFDDPGAVRALIERNGPYPSIASHLPASATRGAPGGETEATQPWFRANWAVDGQSRIDGVDALLNNPRFIAAAGQLFGGAEVTPTTIVVNVNAPMPAGAVHIDIPSFRGATRDRYPLPLLQAMGTSGLFEPWRVVEAGAVSWFYDGAGGAYDYWPHGLDGPMRSERPPFDNVALVADNDRMYHRIGWVGDPQAAPLAISAASTIHHGPGRQWSIVDNGVECAVFDDRQVRISVLWKARVETAAGRREIQDPLTPDQVLDIVATDLAHRGIECTPPEAPLTDQAWIELVHSVYYPPTYEPS